jgi:hypothetical protein
MLIASRSVLNWTVRPQASRLGGREYCLGEDLEPYDSAELDPDSDSDPDEIKPQHPITDCHGSKGRHLWRNSHATSLLVVLTCAWHGAYAVLLVERLEEKSPAVTGRKGNANKARAGSRNGPSGGSMRQNPCT